MRATQIQNLLKTLHQEAAQDLGIGDRTGVGVHADAAFRLIRQFSSNFLGSGFWQRASIFQQRWTPKRE